MYLLYSILLAIGFALMLPLFMLRREKYAAGFLERLGSYPRFEHDERPVIWLHCVSVGETNAARPLVEQFIKSFPEHRLVISTTTKTGQEHARNIFADKADAVVYFPFDFKFSVRRALSTIEPSLVLLMETEIWPRFIREAKLSGAKVAIVNGRLSKRSFGRYAKARAFLKRVLADIDLALMQGEADAERIKKLGIDADKVAVTGNLKFEQTSTPGDIDLANVLRERFGIDGEKPLIIAASTHEPEERYVLESLDGELGHSCRLMIAPRHPERFDKVAEQLKRSSYRFVRRSDQGSENDRHADVILLDTIGELRSAYSFADIVFVGGSLIPHGGQSIIEPAAAGKAIVTGPFTANFDAAVREFLENRAIRQTPKAPDEFQISERLFEQFTELLADEELRTELGQNAYAVVGGSNRNATRRTIEYLTRLATKA